MKLKCFPLVCLHESYFSLAKHIFQSVFKSIIYQFQNYMWCVAQFKYHLYNLNNVEKTHGGVLHLLKLQAKVSIFIKGNTPPWVLFTFFKLCKWYQIARSISYLRGFRTNTGRRYPPLAFCCSCAFIFFNV